MKIKFIKDFMAAQSNDYSDLHARLIECGDIVDVDGCKYNRRYFDMPKEQAQWLIDNGFAEEVKESGWWKPKNGVDYYYLNDAGVIVSREGFLSMSTTDDKRVDIGNAFRSKKATEAWRDYLKANATVRQDEGVLTLERILDEYCGDFIHYIGVDQFGQLGVDWKSLYDETTIASAIYFDTQYHAQNSLDNHPDEWKIIANYDWSRE